MWFLAKCNLPVFPPLTAHPEHSLKPVFHRNSKTSVSSGQVKVKFANETVARQVACVVALLTMRAGKFFTFG